MRWSLLVQISILGNKLLFGEGDEDAKNCPPCQTWQGTDAGMVMQMQVGVRGEARGRA